MYIPLSDDKHREARDSSKSALEIRDKMQSNNFFPDIEKIFFQTEFVLDYKPQLYFVCNLLIIEVVIH